MSQPAEAWEFHCPECGLGHQEFGRLARDQEFFCPICEYDTGRQIKLERWLPEARPALQPRLRVVRTG